MMEMDRSFAEPAPSEGGHDPQTDPDHRAGCRHHRVRADLTTPADEDDDREPLWEAFTVAAMKADRERQEVEFLTVLDERQFRLGILNVPQGPGVGQIVNRLSAIYLVVGGSGRIATGADPGAIAFIPDGVQHQFRRVADPLQVLVVWER